MAWPQSHRCDEIPLGATDFPRPSLNDDKAGLYQLEQYGLLMPKIEPKDQTLLWLFTATAFPRIFNISAIPNTRRLKTAVLKSKN